ncbi:MAG TPA: hypothetical protein VLY23_03720 [Candidatus Acidoferrum sp.]|nr:hypothetical protein [Candidatus Acidoferrum sp.]
MIVKVAIGCGLEAVTSSPGACAASGAVRPAAAVGFWAFALRQSLHSAAGLEPNEKPLNFLPQVGQVGIAWG